MSVGAQIAEPIVLHERVGRRAAWARAVALLDEVGIERPAARAREYPHQFFGGHAAARDDRDGAGVRAGAADRG